MLAVERKSMTQIVAARLHSLAATGIPRCRREQPCKRMTANGGDTAARRGLYKLYAPGEACDPGPI